MRSPFFLQLDQPGNAIVENRGAERIDDKLAVFLRQDETGLLKQVKMMGNTRLADGKVVGDLTGIHIACAQQFENPTASRIIERFEENVHRYLDE